MKKIINVALVVAICFLLTGCLGSKTLKCSSSSDQKNYKISTDYKITAKNKIVKKVEINRVIESKDKKVLENFKKQQEDQNKSNDKAYGGYTYKVTIKGKKLTEKVTIDYTKFDLKKFVKANGAMEEYVNKDKQLTLEGAEKMYKSTGAKCK